MKKRMFFSAIAAMIISLTATLSLNAQMEEMNDKAVFKTASANELRTNLRHFGKSMPCTREMLF
jgi:hypothetical protein